MAKRTAGGAKNRIVLAQNNYGKSRVRMVKVSRDATSRHHSVRELTVDIALEGDFDAIHTRGDNSKCLPTDTMKNTVYALGKDHPLETIESFTLHLAEHFVAHNKQVASARVRIAQVRWDRVNIKGRDHPHCFTRGSNERAVCEVTHSRKSTTVSAGIDDLVILKSTDSAFAGYPKDKLTSLPETQDRIMATSVTARWDYNASRPPSADHGAPRETIRTALIETFATHKSKSVQHTLHAMGKAALEACPAIDRIRLSLPNKHCLLVNLAPFGMANKNEIFVPTDEPFGLIEATIERA